MKKNIKPVDGANILNDIINQSWNGNKKLWKRTIIKMVLDRPSNWTNQDFCLWLINYIEENKKFI